MRLSIKKALCYLSIAAIFVAVAALSSCDDLIDPIEENAPDNPAEQDSIVQPVFTNNTVAAFLNNHPSGQFTDFVKLLTKAGLLSMLNDSTAKYTCFAPTNEAMKEFLQKYNQSDREEDAIYQDIESMPEYICYDIAGKHIIKKEIFISDLGGMSGYLAKANLLDELLSYEADYTEDIDSVTGIPRKKFLINSEATVIEVDDTVSNGVVHIIDNVLFPQKRYHAFIPGKLRMNNTKAPANLKAQLFYEALIATRLSDTLEQYVDFLYPEIRYDSTMLSYLETGGTAFSYRTAFEMETVVFPNRRLFKYTLFAVSDSILRNDYDINTLEDLRNKAKEVYGGNDAAPDNSPESPLYKLLSYHILPCWLPYDQFNVSQQEILRNRLMQDELDVEDFYETMHPYAIMRVSTPLDSKVERKGIYINRKGTVTSNNLTHRGIRIWEPSEYGKLDCQAANGGYHFIDGLLFYDDNTKQALNTRIRVMSNTLSPDFINSGARGRLYGTNRESRVVFGFKKGFCKNVEWTDETGFYVRYRNSSFTSMYGDEMTIRGNYDITFRLPPVPLTGTYEIRVWLNPMPDYCNDRGVAQFYFKSGNGPFQACGNPLDMSVYADDPSIGFISDSDILYDENLSDTEKLAAIAENDRLMRSKGYMKGMDSYAYSSSPFRDRSNCFRAIICRKNIQAGQDYYLRIQHTDGGDICPFNFVEIVPQIIYEGNEDKH